MPMCFIDVFSFFGGENSTGLPVQVRDSILGKQAQSDALTAAPTSDTNKQWFAEQHDRMVS